jgi:hypothetical protein
MLQHYQQYRRQLLKLRRYEDPRWQRLRPCFRRLGLELRPSQSYLFVHRTVHSLTSLSRATDSDRADCRSVCARAWLVIGFMSYFRYYDL